MYNVRTLLSFDCRAADLFLKTSPISRNHARRGVCAGLPIGAREVIGYNNGSLVYSNTDGQKQMEITYGEGVKTVTVEQFSK